MNDRPRERKYARVELDRRFLLDRLPDSVDPNDFERLKDCYVDGTRLRIRRVENPDGSLITTKLGQKRRDPADPENARRRLMTTIYLPPGEESALAGLAGRQSIKRRYKTREQGWTFAIDVYESPRSSAGLIIAEVECDTESQLDAIAIPNWALREITHDESYSGFNLASKLPGHGS